MLLLILQDSKENTCAAVYFLIILQACKPETSLAKLLRTPFNEHPSAIASGKST